MHSPLPDASALEAGILEDPQPSRLSRLQDNVRNLLIFSRNSSAHSSTQPSPRTPTQTNIQHGLITPPESPAAHRTPHQPEVVPSPSAESTTSTTISETSLPPQATQIPGVLFPPMGYQRAVQQMAHQSALFNTRAVAALDHPDLSDPSLTSLVQQKAETRQQRAWKRSRHGSGRRKYRVAEVGNSQWLLCVLSALLLAAIVATYVVLALTSTTVNATFHILFILGILLATIVFVHTVVRLFIYSKTSNSSRRVFILPPSRTRHRRHRRNHNTNPHNRDMPTLSGETLAFVPATPIRVHMPADEVRPDSREAEPTATADFNATEVAADDWDKDIEAVPNPPPAYGRWRGSVRANPDFLHWQVVPSEMDANSPELPSPTYEEAVLAQRTGPPSYVTRESPARQREELRDLGVEVVDMAPAPAQPTTVVEGSPEMVEGRGIGIAS